MTSTLMKTIFRCGLRNKNNFNFLLKRTYCESSSTMGPGCLTLQDVKNNLIDLMGHKSGYSPLTENRDYLLKYLPKSQDELPERTMQDSFCEAYVPLETDAELQDKYITFLGHLRIGRLMEDMDLFAVWVAKKHIENPKQDAGVPSPYVMVTVLVEKITFTDVEQKPNANIRLSGHVSYVGRSSMEIVVWLEQFHRGEWKKLTRAIFLMAARNSNNTGSAPVNPLIAGNASEEKILSGGKDRNARRRKLRSESLMNVMPDECEQQVIHDIFLETLDLKNPVFHNQHLPANSIWMKESKLSNTIFCQPEDRNLHNKVFGGFLMRHAVELSWMLAFLYSKFRPKLLHMADVSFIKPVDVGSLLEMNTLVTYTEHRYAMILVLAQILDPHGRPNTSNNFHIIYEFPQEIKKVVPKSYGEAMLFIEGRRKFQHIMQLSGPTS